MEDPRQTKLFEEDAGESSPPEEGLYLGTCGWSYADWEGTVYPPETTPAGRLAEYVKRFATVEIDSTFYGTPRGTTVERWRKVAPRGFLFAAKFPQQTEARNDIGAGACHRLGWGRAALIICSREGVTSPHEQSTHLSKIYRLCFTASLKSMVVKLPE
jgi:hypothetical protein